MPVRIGAKPGKQKTLIGDWATWRIAAYISAKTRRYPAWLAHYFSRTFPLAI
jgi:hypothetical protein